MALYYSLPVDRDVYRLKIFEHAKDFSREYKYTPGQDLKRDSVVAQSKTEYLEAFLDDLGPIPLGRLQSRLQDCIAGLLEGDEAAGEHQQGEVVLFLLRPADEDSAVAVQP